MTAYKIIRFYQDGEPEVRFTGITLEQAQRHCNEPNTKGGQLEDGTSWFDGYMEEDWPHEVGVARWATSSALDQLADNEWDAWQLLCSEFAAAIGEVDRPSGHPINRPEFDRLVNAIRLWGEELVQLRQTQSPDVVARVLAEARNVVQAQ